MTDQTQRLEIATVRAEIGSNITYRFNNDAMDAGGIPTESGSIKNLKLIIKEIEDKASVSTTIYPTVSAGLAATPEGGMFLVASSEEDEIYVVWRKVGGLPVDTGKRTLSSQAVEDAAEASQASADASEAASVIAQQAAADAAAESGGDIVLHALTNGTDQTDVVVAFFEKAISEKRTWMVPPGDYTINPSAPIYIKTSGFCHGRFLVPKANQTFYFYVGRDVPGNIIPTSGWAFAPKRGNRNVSAFNAAGKNLFINSTEILMERFGEGGPYTPYFKQEFIRCSLSDGSFSTSIVRNYNSLSNMIVTAHTPSSPIRIDGLSVLLTGASGGIESNRGRIVVSRDNVVVNHPYVHNLNSDQPAPIAIEVSYCADVVINQPSIRGFNYPGLGYGIIAGTTIGLTINDGNVQDCRHAYTDAFSVDTVIRGGTWSYVIDSHWCDRFIAENVYVVAITGSSAFSMCGDDITLDHPKQSGGRNLLAIRTDTPQMGGNVRVIAPEINSFGMGSESFYVFGFSSPGGTGPIDGSYTQNPRLPDFIEISDVKFTSDASLLYGCRLGTLRAPHATWGVVKISGVWSMSGQTVIGIYAEKNSSYQQDRSPLLISEAYMDCGSNGTAVYVAAFDGVTARSMNVRVKNLIRGSLRYSGYGVNVLKASQSSILSIVDDNPSGQSIGMSSFNDCLMLGGSVSSTLKNVVFQVSQFAGSYAEFPAAANVTMVGNVKSSTVTGLPADIRGNVSPPFN